MVSNFIIVVNLMFLFEQIQTQVFLIKFHWNFNFYGFSLKLGCTKMVFTEYFYNRINLDFKRYDFFKTMKNVWFLELLLKFKLLLLSQTVIKFDENFSRDKFKCFLQDWVKLSSLEHIVVFMKKKEFWLTPTFITMSQNLLDGLKISITHRTHLNKTSSQVSVESVY